MRFLPFRGGSAAFVPQKRPPQGKITGKYVIYRGKTQDVDGIKYVNVEEYLNNLAS